MSLLKGLQHAQSCLGETRCSDRDGHALAVQALAVAIAAAESAPAVVTAEEILPVLLVPARARVHNDLHLAERAAAVAALVAERTAVAVAAARAEERERIAALVDAGWALLHAGQGGSVMDARTREALEGVWAHVTRYEQLSAEALARPDAEEQDLDACHVYMASTLPLLLRPLRTLLDAPEAPLRGVAVAEFYAFTGPDGVARVVCKGHSSVPAVALAVAGCESLEDAERVAAALSAVLARMEKA